MASLSINKVFLAIDTRSYAALAFLLIILGIVRAVTTLRVRMKMPPGPSGIPLLGNMLQVPRSMPWFKFSEWKGKYGPIFTLNMAGNFVVVVNSLKVTADLLDRKSSIYSDRPRFVMVNELLAGGKLMPMTSYNDLWKRMRRAAHEGFNMRGSEQYQPMHMRETRLTILDIIARPNEWDKSLKQMTASSVLSAVYGWPRLSQRDAPIVERIHAHIVRIASTGAKQGRYLVDAVPALSHLPSWIVPGKREALEWYARETEMFIGLNREVRERMDKGVSEKCFARSLFESAERHGLTEDEAAWVAGQMFSAGATTTSTALEVFVLAMLLYPGVMCKAQEELDNVVGRSRPPSFEDKTSLPYVYALVQEVLRWRPVTPLAAPHRSTEDDWYEGFFIPKGTIIIPNVWAINRDPDDFPDYDVFRPERFLDAPDEDAPEDAPAGARGRGVRHGSYGFGRRICVGMHFANQALFIGIATMLWALDIRKARNETGEEVIPDPDAFVDDGLVVGPAPFKCVMTPRFPDVVVSLERELAADV